MEVGRQRDAGITDGWWGGADGAELGSGGEVARQN